MTEPRRWYVISLHVFQYVFLCDHILLLPTISASLSLNLENIALQDDDEETQFIRQPESDDEGNEADKGSVLVEDDEVGCLVMGTYL